MKKKIKRGVVMSESLEWLNYYKQIIIESNKTFRPDGFELVEKELEALEIIKDCLVSEFKLFEKDGEYFILFYFDEIHELIFKLKNKEEYDLLKEVLK